MRLIDADALKGAFMEELFVKSGRSVQDLIDHAPTIEPSEQYKKGFEDAKRAFELEYARENLLADKVEVVRCKDCIHRIDRRSDLGHFMCEMFYGQGDVSDENFCQWGERKV